MGLSFETRASPAPQDEERSRTYLRLSAGITSLANQMSCSLNSLGGRPSVQWIMKFSSPGYLSATDLMPSMTCAGGPQNQAFCATPSRSEGTPAGAPGVPQGRPDRKSVVEGKRVDLGGRRII